MPFIAGPYTGVYNSLALGQCEDGYTLDFAGRYEEVTGDNFAESVQELIWRGANMFLSMTLLEYNSAAAASAFWPWAAFGTIGQVGRVVTSAIGGNPALAKTTVLTAVAGTTATGTPATLTTAFSILAPNMNISMIFAPRLRRVPIRFQCLPNTNGVLIALT